MRRHVTPNTIFVRYVSLPYLFSVDVLFFPYSHALMSPSPVIQRFHLFFSFLSFVCGQKTFLIVLITNYPRICDPEHAAA